MSDSLAFTDWEPIYEAILADFGFDRAADERARDVAAEFAEPFDHDCLAALNGANVAVVGAAPSLMADLTAFDQTASTPLLPPQPRSMSWPMLTSRLI